MPATSAITGLREVMDNLDRLGKSGKKITRRALTEAIKPYPGAMKPLVKAHSTDTKLLARSLGSQVKDGKRGLTASAGPRKGFEEPTKPGKFVRQTRKRKAPKGARRPTRYAHLVEKGHNRGAGTSAARPYPFMGPVEKARRTVSEQIIARELWAGLQAEIRSA